MGYCNYRVMRKKNIDGQDLYGIYEVYYSDDGKIDGYTDESLTPYEASITELKKTLQLMITCLDEPCIDSEE